MSATERLTREQISAADPQASVWVTASAGTGKTQVLTNRVLRLLLAGTRPERILCLTFTKAAAAEMANRLHRRLGEWAIADDATLAGGIAALTGAPVAADDQIRARRLFARVLETPGGLKVQTIHAFCESLLGRFPLEADVAPHFQVMDERTAGELLIDARDRVLAAEAESGSKLMAALSAHVEEQAFSEIMTTLSNERGRLRRLLDQYAGIDGLIAAIRAALSVADDATEASVVAAACADLAIDVVALRGVLPAMADGGTTDAGRAAAIAAWLDDPAGRPDRFEAYCAAFLTQAGEVRDRLVTKAVLETAPDADDVLRAEAARLYDVRQRLKAVRLAEATAALLRLGDRLIATYEDEKRRRALLDYDDLILHTRDLLTQTRAAAWVLYKLDGGLDHILIDEAQDTNPDQWRVVQALAEEFFVGSGAREEARTVFAVGDPKQSIYSFQRADPQAFSDMRAFFGQRIGEARALWRPVELLRSYRSTPSVLAFVDRVFADADARDGLFAEDTEIRHLAHRRGHAGLVELWPPEAPEDPPARAPWSPPLEQEPDDSPVQRLAGRIADLIRRWLDNGEMLESAGRPIRAGDIMILVQRRAPFLPVMVRQLKACDIPVAGLDRMVLADQLAVMDLMAAARFLLLPADDLTCATVLKGPLIGLSEDALFDLAHDRGGETLWRRLARRRDERPDFADAHARLADWLARADFAAPFAFFARLLGAEGGRRRLVARLGAEANEPIDEFLGLALEYERAHPPSLQGFLAWLEAGAAEVKRDQEQRRDEVRVMTVHGAKGLQAPVVFLPDTVRAPDPRQDGKLFWLADGGVNRGLVWVPRREMEETVAAGARQAARARRSQEYRRLFYVALTRAEDRLYICGWQTGKDRPAGCWYDFAETAMRDLGGEVALDGGEVGLRLSNPQIEPAPVSAASAQKAPSPLPDWAARPAPPEADPPRPLVPSRPVEADPPAQPPLGADRGVRFRRGNLIHRLLQGLPDLPADARAAAAARYLANPAHGLPPEAQREIAGETLAVLADPGFADIFGSDSRAEAPIAGRIGDRIIAARVDRLRVSDAQVLVIDYKTQRPPPATADAVPDIYLKQMAAYRAALREIYPDRPVRCALLWTDGPRLMPLDDGLLDRHAP